MCAVNGNKAVLREWSLFLEKSNHIGQDTPLELICPPHHFLCCYVLSKRQIKQYRMVLNKSNFSYATGLPETLL